MRFTHLGRKKSSVKNGPDKNYTMFSPAAAMVSVRMHKEKNTPHSDLQGRFAAAALAGWEQLMA